MSKAKEPELIGVCTFGKDLECNVPGKPGAVTKVCKEMLQSALVKLEADESLTLRVVGNHNQSEDPLVAASRANNTLKYLADNGIASGRITVSTGTSGDRTVELWLVYQDQ